ncbi:MAG: transglutaminase N-terminal domain-containing protein [Granulosicoccus sp.]
MKLHVRHKTLYDYSEVASQSHNHVCLQPRSTPQQRCLHTRVAVSPEPDSIQEETDVFNNKSTRFSIGHHHKRCEIVVSSLVETTDKLEPLPQSMSVAENLCKLETNVSDDALMAFDCLLASPYIPSSNVLDDFIEEFPVGDKTVIDYANKLMEHIFNTFEYSSGFSTIVTPLSKIYKERKGVCQDFAHLAIAALRQQNIPARYVSGYLETLPPPGQTKLQGADASHAWYSVFDAKHGWFDFDPTNNKRPDAQYITTAWGRDYADVTPIKGVVYGGGNHSLIVEVDVTRSGEAPVAVAE